MENKLYINNNECAIYQDGELYSIVKLSEIDEELLKTLKLIFPKSDIQILGWDKLKEGMASKFIETQEEEF